MRLPWSRPRAAPPPGDPAAVAPHDAFDVDPPDVFVCTTCGRTDLPQSGDWDPPVCLECDAALNFDVEELEAGWER
jgi:hypothetical protein